MTPLIPNRRVVAQRGFLYLIGLLIVIAIIMILYGDQLKPDSSGRSVQQMALDRSKDTACMANRQVVVGQLAAWTINHPGEQPTLEKLQQSGGSVVSCPQHGTYTIGADGQVYCSIHYPDPASAQPTPSAGQ